MLYNNIMLTEDIQEYRKIYYRKHRQYLLEYSKWYYSTNQYNLGNSKKREIIKKPIKIKIKKEKKEKKKKQFTITKGNFTLEFK